VIDARILILAAFVSTLTLGIFLLVRRSLDRRHEQMQRRLKGATPSSDADITLSAVAPPEQGWAERLDGGFDAMIARTGLDVEPAQALGLIALTAVGLAGILFLWRGEVWLSVLGLILGGGGVLMIFLVMQNRHRRTLSDQLPDALYLLARSLRAGLSLEQAIGLTSEQGAQPLAGEFGRCAAQLRLGLAIPIALEAVAKRIQLLDFNVFVTTVSLHHTMGGNLALLLDRLAAGTRDRNLFRGHFQTATALSRVTAIFIGIMSPLLLLLYAIFKPEHVRSFFESPNGWIALAVAAALQIIGIAWLYRLLRVDY
jgi:tight adherence protein B